LYSKQGILLKKQDQKKEEDTVETTLRLEEMDEADREIALLFSGQGL